MRKHFKQLKEEGRVPPPWVGLLWEFVLPEPLQIHFCGNREDFVKTALSNIYSQPGVAEEVPLPITFQILHYYFVDIPAFSIIVLILCLQHVTQLSKSCSCYHAGCSPELSCHSLMLCSSPREKCVVNTNMSTPPLSNTGFSGSVRWCGSLSPSEPRRVIVT